MEYPDEEPGADVKLLMAEMKNQNFDVIRFASYRTACKLRFIQKRCQLHLVDLWNLIEAFRENALNAMDAQAPLGVTRVRALLGSLYYQLNKRLPPSQQLDLPHCVSLLLNWLLASYDPEQQGCLRVLSLKVALAILCAGKLLDKLRYLFSLLADGSGRLPVSRFGQLLEEALVLPASVLESPSFHYTESLPGSIFHQSRVTLNEFLSVLTSDGGPECLVWMPLLHRMANVENVLHPVQCDGCNRDSFLGFRYKCQRCYNYQLCQDCFWRGRTSGSHTNQHEMKEYAVYKSASKQLGHSLRKSFRCVPERPGRPLPHFPEEEHTLDLAHIVPPSPAASHNGLPSLVGPPMDSGQDEEHRLIARYAARLAQRPAGSTDTLRQRELLAQLEAKNREMMGQIVRLRQQQEREESMRAGSPALVGELQALRQRKAHLEAHLAQLQDSRRDLMLQLEALMKMLKNHQRSPRSTPGSSPRSTASPPERPPIVAAHLQTPDSLVGLGADVQLAFGRTPEGRQLRDHLLVAADSVTHAMSSLVRELHSGVGSEEEEASQPGAESEGRQHNGCPDASPQELSPSCLQPGTTDDDSYVRTEDEEEATNTDWEETVHRWVNR
ncbi:hypothetical protein V5799_009682 [Amblyomma americanum]|uniref:Dystrobrevin n=1 Tax=Amblyomma americanum TaxID=6943 RepID=A0AAQ4FB21_AMBAM